MINWKPFFSIIDSEQVRRFVTRNVFQDNITSKGIVHINDLRTITINYDRSTGPGAFIVQKTP